MENFYELSSRKKEAFSCIDYVEFPLESTAEGGHSMLSILASLILLAGLILILSLRKPGIHKIKAPKAWI